VKLQVLLLLVLQGPASQQVHEEEVKTLISEAVQAKEAEHAADLTRLLCSECKLVGMSMHLVLTLI